MVIKIGMHYSYLGIKETHPPIRIIGLFSILERFNMPGKSKTEASASKRVISNLLEDEQFF